MSNLSIKKIRDMLAAHNDGVYLLGARDNIGEIIDFLLAENKMYEDRLLPEFDIETGTTCDRLDRLVFEVEELEHDNEYLTKRVATADDKLQKADSHRRQLMEALKSLAEENELVAFNKDAQHDMSEFGALSKAYRALGRKS